MKSRLRSTLTFLIGWPFSIIALIFIVRLIISHYHELSSHLVHINTIDIFLGFFCFLSYYFFRSYIYQKILNFLGYPLKLQETALYWGQSEIQRYIPGSIWAFVGRTVLFSRKSVEKKDITTSLIIESQLVLIGTLLAMLLGGSFILTTFLPSAFNKSLLLTIVWLGIITLTVVYIFFSYIGRKIQQKLLKRIFATPFTPKENSVLVLLSFLCYLLFGMGYYFIVSSVYTVNLQLFWQLSGFFSFSLLVGYLSLLTPTGLGVREGVILLGLKKLMPAEIIGFAAIFARVALILTEVFYLIISYFWHEAKGKRVISLETFFSKHKPEIILSFAIILYLLYFTTASFLRYTNFYSGRFDLGNMAQTVWNTSRGNIFQFTNPNGTEEISRLAFHADFILILLAPFYLIWSDPRMLLLIQTLIVAAGSIFVYLIARDSLKGKTLPLILSLIFLLNPALQRANLYDFHAVTLATTFLLGAFYFQLKKKDVWFVLFLILAGLTKEEVWLIVAFFGVYQLLKKRFVLGLVLLALGGSMFTYLLFYAIPQNAGSQHFALAYYSDYGDRPGRIIKNMLLSPQKTFTTFFGEEQRKFIRQLLGPVGFLPLLSPLYLLFAIGDIVIDFMSNNPQLHQIYYQYTATITPFIFISTIYTVKRICRFRPAQSRVIIGLFLLFATTYTAYLYGPLPGAKESNLDMFTKPLPHATMIDSYLTRLPKGYSIAASNNVGSHLSNRRLIYTVPLGIDKADVIALLPDTTTQGSDYVQVKLISQLRSDPNYFIYYDLDGFIVFKKVSESTTMR